MQWMRPACLHKVWQRQWMPSPPTTWRLNAKRRGLGTAGEVAMATEAIFANNLAAEREAKGLGTAEELARRAGIEPSLYAKIEAGEVLPSPPELNRLLQELGDADRE